ncbi:MAG TPA: DUF1365 domain-containing protein [Caulobacteraceae bacterium]
MNSALYVGWVSHRRFGPKPHRLRYAVFQLLLDLDEAEAFSRRLRLFSTNRFNLFSHYDRDHGERKPARLRAWAEEKLAEGGMAIQGGRIMLLAMPRLLGHVFNPLSIYYCHRPDGPLAAVIYEVNNTFGERHAYVLAADSDTDGPIRQSCAKAFRVSPFMDLALGYEFDLSRPGETLRAEINARDGDGELVLSAVFAGERRELTDRNLLMALVRFPLMTLKVVAAIHYEAVKLWLKGVKPATA